MDSTLATVIIALIIAITIIILSLIDKGNKTIKRTIDITQKVRDLSEFDNYDIVNIVIYENGKKELSCHNTDLGDQ